MSADLEPFRLAAVFDTVHPRTGPGFAPDRPRIDDPERRGRLVAYLDSGVPVLMTPALMDDCVDPRRTASVPMNFRTDGTWIWTDTVTYYLKEHHLAPEPALLDHVEDQDAFAWQPDAETMERAVDFVLTPPDPENEPVWVLGGGDAG